jgi:dTDP-4-amino-4,6-dideoxygalactose transaminase
VRRKELDVSNTEMTGWQSEKIASNRLDRGFFKYQEEFESKALEVLRSGWYVLGDEVRRFEEGFASYLGEKHCVGVASGLDALWIAFRVLGIGAGDEVIVQGNTFIASVMGITINGATPVFVEPDEYYAIDAAKIEEKITDKTKAILVVHLYGQASDMDTIMDIAHRHGLKVVEDCAQSHGAKFKGKMTGTFGDIGCFSFYPSKNLGAFGDAGAIVTNDDKIAEDTRVFRNYGSQKHYYNRVVGANSRLDELQAGLLSVRLSHMDELEEEKVRLGERYLKEITNPKITLPSIRANATHVWHQFVVRCETRDDLMEYLDKKGIGTMIHYPVPPHLSEAYEYLGMHEGDLPITEHFAKTVMSLPMYIGLTYDEQTRVIEAINEY